MGTPQYVAPEQLDRPAEVDHRADIYYNNEDSTTQQMGDRREELTDKVLANLSRQTGLSFTRQRDEANIWVVSEDNREPASQAVSPIPAGIE